MDGIDFGKRIVTALPLKTLVDFQGASVGKRGPIIGSEDLRCRLSGGLIHFLVANVGEPLKWIAESECYDFWKTELKSRLVEPALAQTGFIVDQYLGHYCYVASEWSGIKTFILLEKYH